MSGGVRHWLTLIVTVDTPGSGARHRDTRNGMTLPPTFTAKTILDASCRPEWWFNFLTTKPLGFANFEGGADVGGGAGQLHARPVAEPG